MKILKKTNPVKVEEKPIVEEPKKALDEGASMTLTSEEISQLKEALPKLIALLDGEAEIEIIDDEEADTDEEVVDEELELEDPAEVVSMEDKPTEEESTEEESTEEESTEEEPKAEDDASTFNAEEILKDPAKKAALEKALGIQKATDEQPKTKKVFVKKTIGKKAGDSLDVPPKKPNAELVETPDIDEEKVSERVIRKFDFHKNQK